MTLYEKLPFDVYFLQVFLHLLVAFSIDSAVSGTFLIFPRRFPHLLAVLLEFSYTFSCIFGFFSDVFFIILVRRHSSPVS